MEPNSNPYTPPSAGLDEVSPKPPVKVERPASITVICILGFIGALAMVPMLLNLPSDPFSNWFRPYLIASSLVGLFSFIAMWRMKKIGAYVYAGFFVLGQIFFLAKGMWTLSSLLIPGVVTLVALKNVSKMS